MGSYPSLWEGLGLATAKKRGKVVSSCVLSHGAGLTVVENWKALGEGRSWVEEDGIEEGGSWCSCTDSVHRQLKKKRN